MTKKNQIINGKKEGYWEENFSFLKEDKITRDDYKFYGFCKDNKKWMQGYFDFWEIPPFFNRRPAKGAEKLFIDKFAQKGKYKNGLKFGEWKITIESKFTLNLEIIGKFVNNKSLGGTMTYVDGK